MLFLYWTSILYASIFIEYTPAILYIYIFQISAKLMAPPQTTPQPTPVAPTPAITPEERECDTYWSLIKLKLLKLHPRIRDEILQRIQAMVAEALRQQEEGNLMQQGNMGLSSYGQRPPSQSSMSYNASQQQVYSGNKRFGSQSDLSSLVFTTDVSQVSQLPINTSYSTIDEDTLVRYIRGIQPAQPAQPAQAVAAATTAAASSATSSAESQLQASNLDKTS